VHQGERFARFYAVFAPSALRRGISTRLALWLRRSPNEIQVGEGMVSASSLVDPGPGDGLCGLWDGLF